MWPLVDFFSNTSTLLFRFLSGGPNHRLWRVPYWSQVVRRRKSIGNNGNRADGASQTHLPWLTHQERALPDVAIDGRIAALSRGVRSTCVWNDGFLEKAAAMDAAKKKAAWNLHAGQAARSYDSCKDWRSTGSLREREKLHCRNVRRNTQGLKQTHVFTRSTNLARKPKWHSWHRSSWILGKTLKSALTRKMRIYIGW